ncbi:ATP-binding protein [Sorangium cellulosum]|uniref:ATP-binding protein n=1 Tax=Sorangium cellulosum TaxID=56 RepID=UPI0002E62564|nr:ATP-binding protein [Sorangium cellulosum]
MPTLIYNPGGPEEQVFLIGDAAIAIGRAEDQAICIPHRSLSRSQARIEPSEGRFFIVDLQSKNGTFVNGARVQRKEIRSGDTITLGDLDLLFTTDGAPSSEPSLRPQAIRPLKHTIIGKLVQASEPGAPGCGPRAEARLQILIEVAKLLPVSDDIDTLLHKILDLIFRILDVDRGAVLLVNETTKRLERHAVKTSLPLPDDEPIFSQNIVDYVLRKSVAALFADAVLDPRLDAARSVVTQSIRASMCVPLKPKDDVIGVLYVDNRSAAHVFTEADLEFLVAFASQAAVAVKNASLYQRLERETVERMQLVLDAKLASLSGVVAGIAHEIRNPLNFMNNFASIAAGLAQDLSDDLHAQGARLDPDALAQIEENLVYLRDSMARITEHGRRADAIITGMLQHTRRPSGERALADLNAVVDESVRHARAGAQCGELEVRVVAAYDPAIGPVEMAALDMGRVFLNVVDNALYAMRQKKRERGAAYTPELSVSTADRGEQVEVRIRDNGMGIPKDAAARLFEPFFTTKPPGQGTGLGLSLSREIVVQGHRGTMRVDSEEGEYTEFVITLPKENRGAPLSHA